MDGTCSMCKRDKKCVIYIILHLYYCIFVNHINEVLRIPLLFMKAAHLCIETHKIRSIFLRTFNRPIVHLCKYK
jgi:hypothetical protein